MDANASSHLLLNSDCNSDRLKVGLSKSSNSNDKDLAERKSGSSDNNRLVESSSQKLANNSSVGSCKTSSNKSYSRLFRQYLPGSFNLNLNANQSVENHNNNKLTYSSQANNNNKEEFSSAHSSSGRLVSAFARLKVSPWRLSEPRTRPINSHPSAGITDQQHHSSSLQVKRTGFLYLKRREEKKSRIVDSSIGELIASDSSLEQQQRKTQQKRRDLNNNSISSLLSSTCHQHDEHKAFLLDDEDEEDSTRDQQKQEQQLKADKMSVKRNSPRLALSVVLALTCLMAAMSFGRLALGQQSQQQPTFRSQPLTPATLPASAQQSAGSGNSAGSSRASPQLVTGSLVANINCNKIRGHVTLTPNGQSGTTVSTQIVAGPPGEVYQWSVHQFPVKPGAAMCSCSPLILGTKLIDLSKMHGNLPSDQEFSVQSSLSLFGSESPVGHSLMLRGMKTGMVACATFLPTR